MLLRPVLDSGYVPEHRGSGLPLLQCVSIQLAMVELGVDGRAEDNCPDSYVYAYDESSGTAIWTCPGSDAAVSSSFAPDMHGD